MKFKDKNNNILNNYDILQISRNKNRFKTQDFIDNIFDEFIELHGDRISNDDKAIIGGIARIGEKSFIFVGNHKGNCIKENIERNFGMAKPSGYRKALRLFKFAERFNMPIITFLDTQGAYPDIEKDSIAQAEVIATNLMEMSSLKTRIISIVIGEAASGGALALGVADKFFMLENSVFSVISPESAAAILYKDKNKVLEIANNLKISAKELKKFNIIDDIIEENSFLDNNDIKCISFNLKKVILNSISELEKIKIEKIIENRYNKYKNIGKNFIYKE